uniref:Uncharacterized protein n=1 Tax=Plectus sambesii TaxID=2011161 RepID=A0A914V5L1_9BILA
MAFGLAKPTKNEFSTGAFGCQQLQSRLRGPTRRLGLRQLRMLSTVEWETGQFQGFARDPAETVAGFVRSVERPEGRVRRSAGCRRRLDKQHESRTAGPGPANSLATEGTVYNGAHARRCAPAAEMPTWLPPPPPSPASCAKMRKMSFLLLRPPPASLLSPKFTMPSITHDHLANSRSLFILGPPSRYTPQTDNVLQHTAKCHR